jgi:hypothetical protein
MHMKYSRVLKLPKSLKHLSISPLEFLPSILIQKSCNQCSGEGVPKVPISRTKDI